MLVADLLPVGAGRKVDIAHEQRDLVLLVHAAPQQLGELLDRLFDADALGLAAEGRERVAIALVGVDEVAERLGRALSTTYGYLEAYVRHRRILDPVPWVTPSDFAEIAAAAEEIGANRLRPIYDALDDNFQCIIDHAVPTNNAVSLESGLVYPLDLTASKCRHPMIRRKALALLEQLHLQEGPWLSDASYVKACAIIADEEGSEQWEVGGPRIPEFRRIHGILIDMSQINDVSLDSEGKVASVGPGAYWGDVMTALAPHGATVVGARAPYVGVGGLLLGGKCFLKE